MPEYNTLQIDERDDGIAILTLNRPDRLNAVSFELIEEINDYLFHLGDKRDLRVLILTGAGRAFSAGLDLREASVMNDRVVPEEYRRFEYLNTRDKVKRMLILQEHLVQVMIRLRRIPQVVIAAVKGPAYGAGFTLTLASDIRIAGESAVFCNAFIKIGLSGADCGSTYFLPRLIGASHATEILLTAKNVDSVEADRIGLVSRVVPDDQILDASLEMAQQILEKSPLGARLTKEAINFNVDAQSLEAAIAFENKIQNLCSNTKDILEGGAAVLEKRKPHYDPW